MISLKEALVRKNRSNVNDDINVKLKNQEILDFIKNNYRIYIDVMMNVEYDHPEKYISIHDSIVDIIGGTGIGVNTSGKAKEIKSLTNGLFKFGKIDGNFICSNTKIKSLEGAPEVVDGSFDCSHCDDLVSLKGAPEQCEKFVCSYCPKLTNLKGISKKINYGIWCNECENLKSIDDISSDFKGVLYITSVDGFDLSRFKGKVDIYSKTKIIQRDGKILIPKNVKNGVVRGWKELRKNTAPPFVR